MSSFTPVRSEQFVWDSASGTWKPMSQPTGGTGGTASQDEAGFTAGTTDGTPMMGVYESIPTPLSPGQLGIVELDEDRNICVNVKAGSTGNAAAGPTGSAPPADADYVGYQDSATGDLTGLQATALDFDTTGGGSEPITVLGIALPSASGPVVGGTTTNPVRTDPTGTTTQPVSASSLPLPAGAATAAHQTDASQKTQVVDGSGNVIGATSNALDINIKSGNPTTMAATQATAASLNAQVVGSVASGSSDSGNPVKIGSLAETSLPTVVTAGQRVNVIADVYGRPFVRDGTQGPSTAFTNSHHAPSTNTQASIVLAAAGPGIRNVCTSLTVSLAAGATAPAAIQTSVALIDGDTGGTTYLWGPTVISLPAVAGATSAFVLGKTWKPGTANTKMTLEFAAAAGANTIESVSFDSVTVAE